MRQLSLVEVVVGVGIFLIVFMGIFGILWLNFRTMGLMQRKIDATQIAQGEIEKIRNLPYLDVGIQGLGPQDLPRARGILEESTTTILNNVVYNIKRDVEFVADSADTDEECQWDYKRVKVSVSFSGILKGEVTLFADVFPKDKVEELAACQQQPGGVLSVQVLNSKGEFVTSSVVKIYDEAGNLKTSKILEQGKWDFPLATGTYKVVATKEGYSTEQTYSNAEIPIPEKPNPIVLENQITQISFSIDKLSSMLVKTLSSYGVGRFFDSFEDETKISQKFQVSVFGGRATLATTTEGVYFSSGYLFSQEISPPDLVSWRDFSFDDEEPSGTDLKYQFFYYSGTEWVLVPDTDLPGNSQGFDQSPVNLSNLSPEKFPKLKVKANFSTTNNSLSPVLQSWEVTWNSTQGPPIPNVYFDLRGEKIIGRDLNENPIYKFSTSTQTDNQGLLQLSNLEWDVYHFSNFRKDTQALELVASTPPHPVSLLPDQQLNVFLVLQAQNSLLVTVEDAETLQPIFSATTTLSRAGFSQTQYTGAEGQTIFIPLEAGSYDLTVEASGYSSTSTSVSVSGRSTITIKMEPTD